MIENLIYKEEQKEKTGFYASDVLKSGWELYHAWKGTPKTNLPQWYETLKWGAGNGVEASMLKVLKDSGIVNEDYDQHVHGKINHNKYGFEIHGRIDAMTKDGFPIEIKSVNNKNAWDIKAYADGYPRENYVGQLSVYMDALGVDTGYLFVATVDGLNTFWFKCTRVGDKFVCGKVEFDLGKEIERWRNLMDNHVLKDIEPDPFEYIYKIPIEKIDWSKMSKDKISKARNNHAVIGDFQITYSPWKDLWIKKQGQTIGYTAEELIKINELTSGYSTWTK
jgi:hypothetical protein